VQEDELLQVQEDDVEFEAPAAVEAARPPAAPAVAWHTEALIAVGMLLLVALMWVFGLFSREDGSSLVDMSQSSVPHAVAFVGLGLSLMAAPSVVNAKQDPPVVLGSSSSEQESAADVRRVLEFPEPTPALNKAAPSHPAASEPASNGQQAEEEAEDDVDPASVVEGLAVPAWAVGTPAEGWTHLEGILEADRLHQQNNPDEELELLQGLGAERRVAGVSDAEAAALRWRYARAMMGSISLQARGGLLDPAAARAKYRVALRHCEEALELDGQCSPAYTWASILVVKAADGFSEMIKSALTIRDLAAKAASVDPTDPVPRFVLGMFCMNGAGLSWFEKRTVSMLFGGDLSATYDEAVEHLEASLRLWRDRRSVLEARGRSGSAPPMWPGYLPEHPWKSLFANLARCKIRAGQSGAAEVLEQAKRAPAPTCDESADTEKDLRDTMGEL
jgi:hypothetical protein